MLSYILRRILMMIPVLIIISIISFTIIELPPGDFVTSYIARLGEDGTGMAEARAEALMARFGVGEAFHIRYWKWITGFVRGDLGFSFLYNAPVNSVIGERLLLTFLITLGTVIFTWAVAFPIGVYSAIKQYSAGDYIFTFIGFLGLAIPNFLLALLFMYISFAHLGWSVGGLFSPEYLHLPWSWGKFVNLLQHLWVPVVVVGTAGTAGMIRILRATLLDELKKAYVTTARAKGLAEWKVILKYPVRLAINPFISTIGWMLPGLISGSIITAIVLNLPTTGPILLNALQLQDMHLAGSFVMLLATLTVIGTLISDILLIILDPRIRYSKTE